MGIDRRCVIFVLTVKRGALQENDLRPVRKQGDAANKHPGYDSVTHAYSDLNKMNNPFFVKTDPE